jgi:hypothetical protein
MQRVLNPLHNTGFDGNTTSAFLGSRSNLFQSESYNHPRPYLEVSSKAFALGHLSLLKRSSLNNLLNYLKLEGRCPQLVF